MSDTNSTDDGLALDSELSQLGLEIIRIGRVTSFAGQTIFDGNTHFLQIGFRSANTLEVQSYTLTATTLGLNQDFTSRSYARNYLGVIAIAIGDNIEKKGTVGRLLN